MTVIVAVGTGTPSPPPCGVFIPSNNTAPLLTKAESIWRVLCILRERKANLERGYETRRDEMRACIMYSGVPMDGCSDFQLGFVAAPLNKCNLVFFCTVRYGGRVFEFKAVMCI